MKCFCLDFRRWWIWQDFGCISAWRAVCDIFCLFKDCVMRLVGRFWFCGLYKLCLGLAVVSMIGCGTKSPNKENIGNKDSSKQNIGKVRINISSQIDGLNKSVLTYWCKVDDKSAQDNKEYTIDATPPKCKAIGGANAFFRALKTSRFHAPRDEVVELEAGVYYLASFEIEAKRHILRSCDKEASKCGGYEGDKPRFLAFRIDSGENLTLPKVLILPKTQASQTNLSSDFDSQTNDKKGDKSKDSKKAKKAKKSKNDEPKELIFVILEDFDKQGNENPPYKAESKRGNAIFSLGSSVSFEFDSTQNNNKNNPNHKH